MLNRLESRQYSPPSCYMQHTRLSLAYDAVEDDDRPTERKEEEKIELLNDEMPRTVHRNLLLYVLYGKVSSSIFLPFSLKSLRPPSFFLS